MQFMESLAENASASVWSSLCQEVESQKTKKQSSLSKLRKGCRERRTHRFRVAQVQRWLDVERTVATQFIKRNDTSCMRLVVTVARSD